MPSVYCSPSAQEANLYYGGGTEEHYMNLLMDEVIPLLQYNKFTTFRNKPEMTLREIIADSNAKKPDIHLAVHSNAGGGKGCEVFAYTVAGKVSNSQKLAEALYSEVEVITPPKDRGVKDGKHLGEVRSTNATAALIEVEFHDSEEGASWIRANIKSLAIAIAKGVCKYFNVQFNMPQATDYRVLYNEKVFECNMLKAEVQEVRKNLDLAESKAHEYKATLDKIKQLL